MPIIIHNIHSFATTFISLKRKKTKNKGKRNERNVNRSFSYALSKKIEEKSKLKFNLTPHIIIISVSFQWILSEIIMSLLIEFVPVSPFLFSMTSNVGIMTLSRSPYSELDKMSLFQDLKLKRRKVDSRCSSDGESLADTNASSPDLIVPLSPKMCDHGGSVSSQQLHSQQTHEKNRNSVSPAALDNDYNSTSTDSTGE